MGWNVGGAIQVYNYVSPDCLVRETERVTSTVYTMYTRMRSDMQSTGNTDLRVMGGQDPAEGSSKKKRKKGGAASSHQDPTAQALGCWP